MDRIYLAGGALGLAAGVYLATRSSPAVARGPAIDPPSGVVMFGPIPVTAVRLPWPRDVPPVPAAEVIPGLVRELNQLHLGLNAARPCVARATDLGSLDACLDALPALLRWSGRLPSDYQGHVPDGAELRRRLRAQPGDLFADLYVLRNYLETRQPGWLTLLQHDW